MADMQTATRSTVGDVTRRALFASGRRSLSGSLLFPAALICLSSGCTAAEPSISNAGAANLVVPAALSDTPHLPAPLAAKTAALEPLRVEPGLREPSLLPPPAVAELLRRLEERHVQVEQLEQRLEERDASVRELEKRLALLETQFRSLSQPVVGENGSVAATVGSTSGQIAASQPQKAATELPESGEDGRSTDKGEPRSAPGQVEVDPEAAERALERTLALTGDLLLPVGKADVEPFLSYEFNDTSNLPASVLVNASGGLVSTNRRVKRDIVTGGINLRAGLPLDSQIEVRLPYNFVRRQETQDLQSQSNSDRSGSGIGDLRVGVATTLLRENGWLPDLIGRVTWDSDTGRESDSGVSLNSDTHEVIGSISAIKRQDPFAFVGRLSYEHAFENDGLQPGDRFGVGAAAVLAASPETSLRISFNASYRTDLEFEGNTIEGTDENEATLSFGVSSILARGTLLNFTAGAGLTDDSPDYTVFLSLPIRMTLW
ncbi:hypothetical protein HBA54_27580 [Pelagibius litoralis]|uniref:Transporter n=1 Tax=Pelagibius litoralis TaxID=374515 RepID=A0A967F3T2_9PROT|nr:transporter [Pelagibius litoralis]NIA72355.1 hypothetical protein [Pelagibius litoralis]